MDAQLTETEERILRAIRDLGDEGRETTTEGLADELDMTVARVNEVLGHLAHMGLIQKT